MKRWQYEISRHPLSRDNRMRIFCSERGECSVEEVETSDSQRVLEVLQERGQEGWELVQILFGRDGFICFWKREHAAEGRASS
ncbi:MAG: hypothetical protein QHH30_07630 [candidate division NC10 bacterium]|nr:hypothetical protein [candidate division NC10 bacterium]